MKGAWMLSAVQIITIHAAILPPPWADPSKNPCASQPGGWLFLFWPPDGKCYRIFQRGYPCPDTMELSPIQDSSNRMIAECRCPPRTAANLTGDTCFPIFKQGPCDRGQYFSPIRQMGSNRQRLGKCVKLEECSHDQVYWPPTGQCYPKFSRGPCPYGLLLTLNQDTQIAECQCSATGPLSKYYWPPSKTCHQYYTRGPCLEKGTLFLPGPMCGCNPNLPNHDLETKKCYEIGGPGPCKSGNVFDLDIKTKKGSCICKPEHVLWSDGQCYRLYTKGPCQYGQIIFNDTTCRDVPCPKGKLYFPDDNSCHMVGVRGPCARGQLVLFEQNTRPSAEGISYRGMCGCSGPGKCKLQEPDQELEPAIVEGRNSQNDVEENKSTTKFLRNTHYFHKEGSHNNNVRICEKNEESGDDNQCHLLYTQGPCLPGEWLVPARQSRENQSHRFAQRFASEPQLFQDGKHKLRARCECKPGYTKAKRDEGCRIPLVTLAKFLNGEDLFR